MSNPVSNQTMPKQPMGIKEMSDDELWEWWLSLSDGWQWLFLRKGLGLK